MERIWILLAMMIFAVHTSEGKILLAPTHSVTRTQKQDEN